MATAVANEWLCIEAGGTGLIGSSDGSVSDGPAAAGDRGATSGECYNGIQIGFDRQKGDQCDNDFETGEVA